MFLVGSKGGMYWETHWQRLVTPASSQERMLLSQLFLLGGDCQVNTQGSLGVQPPTWLLVVVTVSTESHGVCNALYVLKLRGWIQPFCLQLHCPLDFHPYSSSTQPSQFLPNFPLQWNQPLPIIPVYLICTQSLTMSLTWEENSFSQDNQKCLCQIRCFTWFISNWLISPWSKESKPSTISSLTDPYQDLPVTTLINLCSPKAS